MERTALWYGDLSTSARLGTAKLLRLPRPDLPAELIRGAISPMLLGECGWPRGNVAENGPAGGRWQARGVGRVGGVE
jgi:hypothetical protein